MGSLFGSSPIKGINRIRLGPGVGKGLVKGTGSLIPNKMTRIGKRGVEAKHGMEVKTIFLRSTLQLVDLPKEESLAQVEKPMLGR